MDGPTQVSSRHRPWPSTRRQRHQTCHPGAEWSFVASLQYPGCTTLECHARDFVPPSTRQTIQTEGTLWDMSQVEIYWSFSKHPIPQSKRQERNIVPYP